MTNDRLMRVRDKIKERGIHLNPCIDIRELEKFEREHGISLPDDYRCFLLKIGNGGAGPPYYGLEKLGEVPSDCRGYMKQFWSRVPNINRPFPFTADFFFSEDERDLRRRQTEEKLWGNQAYYGNLMLGTDGCYMYWQLIVSGLERGNVWLLTEQGIIPTKPKRDFLRWYEDWLDGVENWWDEETKETKGTGAYNR